MFTVVDFNQFQTVRCGNSFLRSSQKLFRTKHGSEMLVDQNPPASEMRWILRKNRLKIHALDAMGSDIPLEHVQAILRLQPPDMNHHLVTPPLGHEGQEEQNQCHEIRTNVVHVGD